MAQTIFFNDGSSEIIFTQSPRGQIAAFEQILHDKLGPDAAEFFRTLTAHASDELDSGADEIDYLNGALQTAQKERDEARAAANAASCDIDDLVRKMFYQEVTDIREVARELESIKDSLDKIPG